VLEGVGVSAYLGAAAFISTKAYLTAAGSILTVESRHNAYLRAALKERPFAQPFDAPLDFNEVYTLASPFIVDCPSDNPKFISLSAFPGLTVEGPTPIESGSTITLTIEKKKKKMAIRHTKNGKKGCKKCPKVFAAWAAVSGPVFTPVTRVDDDTFEVVVPDGIHGQSYVVLTTSGTDASDGKIIAGPALVEVAGTTGSPTLV
jgi:hypothetical protein